MALLYPFPNPPPSPFSASALPVSDFHAASSNQHPLHDGPAPAGLVVCDAASIQRIASSLIRQTVGMPVVDLRHCPFCNHERPTLVAMGGDKVDRVSVVCPECGTVGPATTADDPPSHAEYLWNQRYRAN